MNGSDTCSVSFSDCVVSESARLGAEGQGFHIAMETLDGGRLSCAAIALGIAQSALDATIAYTKERIQFGKPIAANQGVQWMLVDMATRVDCARMLVLRAAAAKMACEPIGAGKIICLRNSELCSSEGGAIARRHGIHQIVPCGAPDA